ncbi:MAG TPA: Gfo/Idh/MocA family oxidoreductase [Candidatus Paceibacterota bacterium]|nr:Gfo/Idh/MocA family oxidoreductase [Verrucomicrobiota bacterium]HOX02849.1 Gfo/Idh/MocA family oxidoreductase [Verrucomicrobiota bacterium]HRZ45601.1 Gfo/Idh/MocA family oxidoreductase [Candidatus Paceibacterota bacterium]HRZ91396.1 Gfo/Idh/MocA family oxidoreductase [Candidatus Paceibacterota bacterium]
MTDLRILSRRAFLGRGAAAILAARLSPEIAGPGVLAANGQPGANDRIQLGAIGVGRQGGGLVSMFARLKSARFTAIADVNLPRAREVAQPLGAQVFQDYRQLLERKDVDAVITATPEQWRVFICLDACQAGKDLYVEKPMSLTIREGRLIVQAARKHQRIFQTGSQQRSMEPNRHGCELIRNGRIGRIQRVVAYNYPSPWECRLPAQPVPAGLDWDRWCGPVEPVAYHLDIQTPRANPGWLSCWQFSGGEMTGWGSHGFDQVQWALGQDEGGPIEVWTDGPPLRRPVYSAPESRERGDGICRQPKLFFRYPGDIVMELGNGPAGGAVFFGEKGKITIDRAMCKSDPEELAEEPLPAGALRLYRSNHHQQNWLDCIRSRKPPIADAETGHRSATVCHLGNIARLLGRRLKWDPARELFDDAEANSLLDRPRRKGYELPASV